MRELGTWIQSTSLSAGIRSADWLIPILQVIHILMIAVVFVAMLMVTLRILGRMRMDETVADVWNHFAPWWRRGLIVLTLTGIVLTISEPVREFTSVSFLLKMALLAVAVGSAVAFGRALSAPLAAGVGGQPPAPAKPIALATIVLWIAIIFLGRAIAYDVEVWGSLKRFL